MLKEVEHLLSLDGVKLSKGDYIVNWDFGETDFVLDTIKSLSVSTEKSFNGIGTVIGYKENSDYVNCGIIKLNKEVLEHPDIGDIVAYKDANNHNIYKAKIVAMQDYLVEVMDIEEFSYTASGVPASAISTHVIPQDICLTVDLGLKNKLKLLG
jgi:hypothetical protein